MSEKYKSSDPRGPVLLVDWNTNGHHLTYTRLYMRALSELGVDVAVLCGEPDAIEMEQPKGGGAHANVEVQALGRTHYRRPWPQPLRSMLNRRAFKRNFCDAVRTCESRLQRRCALLFFNCMYAHEHKTLEMLAEMSGLPWSGLLLHRLPAVADRKSRGLQQLLMHPKLRTYGALDETCVAREKDAARPPIFFPDLADDTLNEQHLAIQELRHFAKGRPLVLVIGHLKASKGIIALVKAALMPGSNQFAFAFIGRLEWQDYTNEEKMLIDDAIGKTRNCFFKFGHILDEAHYNAYVYASDILFAAYRNFPHSSNTLTKAAIFEKPVIVSEGHLMASRTREYRLGEIVPQDDSGAILQAIRQLSSERVSWMSSVTPRWAEYRSVHSFDTLKRSMAQLLEIYDV